jgi:hypothetical protein
MGGYCSAPKRGPGPSPNSSGGVPTTCRRRQATKFEPDNLEIAEELGRAANPIGYCGRGNRVGPCCCAVLWSKMALSDQPACRYRGRFRGHNRHAAELRNRSFMTHSVTSRPTIAALQNIHSLFRDIPCFWSLAPLPAWLSGGVGARPNSPISGHGVDAVRLTMRRRNIDGQNYTVATQSTSRSNGPGHE